MTFYDRYIRNNSPRKAAKRLAKWVQRLPSAMGGELSIATSELSLKHFKADGTVVDYGIVSRKRVTNAFVAFMVEALANGTAYSTFQNFKYHDSGTGNTAEANTQTALVTPWGGSRTTGTQVNGGSGTAVTYTSVATTAYNNTFAIVEHGLFQASTTGTMMDRSVFTAVNVVNGDSIQFTYVLTVNSEPN